MVELDLDRAIELCYGKVVPDFFEKMYPFTTENIAGYIRTFDFENKSFLTVGSSCDQLINATFLGSKEQILLDVNPFVKYYYNLKKAALIALDYSDFIGFLYVPETRLNKQDYEKVKCVLKEIDEGSAYFWDILVKIFTVETIYRNLFEWALFDLELLIGDNLYLKNEANYNKTRAQIIDVSPVFIKGNIYTTKIERKIDNVCLSNIYDYDFSGKDTAKVVEYYSRQLNHGGVMMATYLYNANNPSVDTEWENLLKDENGNIKRAFRNFTVLKKYILSAHNQKRIPEKKDLALFLKKK